MTRQVAFYAKCRECDQDGICPKCGKKIPRFSPFSDWLRSLEAPLDSSFVSLQNLDYVWHHYRDEIWFITMEEKQHGAKCSAAQRDTHGIVYQLLLLASRVLGIANGYVIAGINSGRGRKKVQYRGHYVLVFEKTTPDDSAWIRINPGKHEVMTNKAGLISLLKTGRLPEGAT